MKHSVWLAPLFLAGCAPMMSTIPGRVVDLMIYPKIAPKIQSVINPLSLSSIATLDIIPYIDDSGSYKPISSITGNPTSPGAADMLKLTQASPSIDPNRPFIIRKLKPAKNYRVRAQAYNQSNVLISDELTSYVDVSVGSNDTPPMANLPVKLLDTPFSANTSVLINNDGRYEYLKATMYLMAGGDQVAVAQTIQNTPELTFSNLQGATDYRLVAEGYKLGAMMASTSLTLNIGNDTLPATRSMSLSIPYVVSTIAGSGSASFAEGIGTAAAFSRPHGLALDDQGNAYIGDYSNNRIRKVVLATGVVSTLAGSGAPTFADGNGTGASFNGPVGVVYDGQGSLYIGDFGNHRIRKVVLATGVVSTVAGSGTPTFADGTGAGASFNGPRGVELDGLGNLYVADAVNHRIRKVVLATGAVSTLAGNGSPAWADGTGTAASFNAPEGLGVDNRGNLYIADTYTHRIRKVDLTTGAVTTLAGNGTAGLINGTGTNAQFYHPVSIICDSQGNVFAGDFHNNCIRKVTPSGVVTTVAGNGTDGYLDGTGLNTKLSNPEEVVIDKQGILYVVEYGSSRLRKVE